MKKEIKITIKNGLYEVTLANVNGKDSKSYEASLKSRTDESKKLIDFAREIGVKNDELLSAAEKATEIVSGYFDENMRG